MFDLIPNRKNRGSLVIAVLLWVVVVSTASGQTTSFTYQGRLTDGGVPANGSYDLQFALWDSASNGNQIGSTQTISNVSVSGGIFTVTLNFGANAFSGNDRFLEIGARISGANSFTLLSPRQQITSTPYAMRSLGAGTADTATTATNATQLGGVAAGNYVQTNDSRLTDARPPTTGSSNYIQNTSSPQANSSFNISGNGVIGGNLITNGNMGIGVMAPTEILHLQKAGAASILLDVGAPTNTGQLHIKRGAGDSYVGPTNIGNFDFWTFENIPIRIAQNGLERIRVDNNGSVGIGTTTPSARLDVVGAINTSTQYNLGGSSILGAPGTKNLFAGSGAGAVNTGAENAFFGFNAGNANTTANGNAFFGSSAGSADTTGDANSFFGAHAGRDNTTGNANAYFGADSGRANTTGQLNSFFGSASGLVNTAGSLNSFFGAGAGEANTTANQNSFFGTFAGNLNTTGADNSFFGTYTGFTNTSGIRNSFFGSLAGYQNTTGNDSAFFGYGSGYSNTTGGANSFFGGGAGLLNTTGTINSFFGRNAGNHNTTGSNNSFFGGLAGQASTTGAGNSFFGKDAGLNNTTGGSNTFFGFTAGGSNTIEDQNTFVGANANGLAGITNATAVGANASVTQSNSLVLGSINGVNGATADTNVGVGTTTPEQRLSVAGGLVVDQANQNTGTLTPGLTFGHASGEGIASNRNGGINQCGLDFYTLFNKRMSIAQTGEVSISVLPAGSFPLCRNAVNQIGDCASSLRYKKDIAGFNSGLDIVNRLRPISYTWKDHDERDLGFAAEEVAVIEPRLVTRNSKGEIQGVKYDRLTAVLVNAIKQQEAQIETQQNQIREQQLQVASLLAVNAKVNARLRIVEHALKQRKHLARRSR